MPSYGENMTESKTLILLDVFGLLYKFFYTLPSMATPGGQPTNAAYGFARTLLKIYKEFSPDYLIPAMESRTETFRHKIYPEYKAHRDKMPENLQSQIPIVMEIMDAMGLPQAQVDGYEADDIIGTLSKLAPQKNLRAFIITGDKDLLQLVNDHVTVQLSKKGVSDLYSFDKRAVFDTLGVNPEHVIDLKALEGDKSDNIPGVPGVGVKTALELLNRFSSIDNLYDHIEDVDKEKLKEKLIQNKDLAFLSKQLATIETDIQLPFKIEDFPFKPVQNAGMLSDIFHKYSFKSLASEVDISNVSQAISINNDNDYKINLEIILDESNLLALIDLVQSEGRLCIDLETSGLDVINDYIVGYSISIHPGKAYYIPVRHCSPKSTPKNTDIFELDNNLNIHDASMNNELLDQLNPDLVLDKLRTLLENTDIKKFGHNLKYDYLMLRSAGVRMHGICFDSMIASYLLNPSGRSHSLKSLAGHLLSTRFKTYEDIVGKGKEQISFQEVPVDVAAEYACNDVDMVLRIHDHIIKELEENALLSVFNDIEMPLVTILADMEFTGVSLDLSMLQKLSIVFSEKEAKILTQIHDVTGFNLNPNSPKQVSEYLFDKLGLPQIKKRSTDIEVLNELTGIHEIIPLLIEFRKISKLRGTYIESLPSLIKKKTGCVHTSYNQHIAATGRLSSSNPNLQNVPIRTQEGREIRRAFIPRKADFIMLSADYSQVEIRILANLCQDFTLIQAFKNNEDIHSRTAAEIFNTPIESITKEQRNYAKTINFGIIYGMREFRLAKEIGISRQEAKSFIERYFSKYPGVKQFIEETQHKAVLDGYVTTMFGRKRRIPELNSRNRNEQQGGLRAAFNTIIQGTAADIMKIAMIRIKQEIDGGTLKALMILQVHDELVFEVSPQNMKESATRISHIMQNATSPFFDLNVPLLVDLSIGPNWLDTEPLVIQ